ncbi:glutamate ABC transporter substrate-binding protein [Nocardioides sp. URHA0020]|uniref:glutamate ABC transporter substrate-binding protein n=1 Tax=Nocardioides sp. URHA0020 TaxID=1380392 RepID=UPI000491E4D3|nr:glutamate ABC transporter substrate-binding protein [Nocardioides sp. URHA0020]
MSARRTTLRTLVAAAALVVLAGCGYSATPIPKAVVPEPAAPASSTPCTDTGDPTRSYQPTAGGVPAPGDVPAGSTMAEIRKRGFLVAGVSGDSYLLASRNPFSGVVEGFDIDMVDQIAAAIFGTAKGHVQLRVIAASDRIPLLQSGEIDVVSRNMTINCARWDQIAFSAEYFHSGQKILVQKGSGITQVEQLSGKRVCAPAGTTSLDNIQELAPDAVPVTAGNHTGCLLKFQNGATDAITGDDTVLAGLVAQDPYAEVVTGKALTDEPYGIGVNADNVDLVRFINAVLEQMRADGSWQASYEKWLKPSLKLDAQQPTPVYGR